jgi:hypothetical protein
MLKGPVSQDGLDIFFFRLNPGKPSPILHSKKIFAATNGKNIYEK